MCCKICGKNLYDVITFSNLFKWNYNVHENCLLIVNNDYEYIVFPLSEKIVLYDYILEIEYDDTDTDYIFFHYAKIVFERALNEREWSVILFIDEMVTNDILQLIINLCTTKIIIISFSNENFL